MTNLQIALINVLALILTFAVSYVFVLLGFHPVEALCIAIVLEALLATAVFAYVERAVLFD